MNNAPVRIPIEGILDLHTFNPKDIKILLPEYLCLCREKGFDEVKIIHGKGRGSLKNYVLKQLNKIEFVLGYKEAELNDGGWGATIVFLKK
ncbi:MAG: Smr/MutS family protein [Acidobacteria bacterium]|nr:Smr/MutS family protein [Acidobacteriota bacterium]